MTKLSKEYITKAHCRLENAVIGVEIFRMESSNKMTRKWDRVRGRAIIFFCVSAFLFASFLINKSLGIRRDQTLAHHAYPLSLPTVKNACTTTLYPSLCFTVLASVPSDNFTTFHHFLEKTINQTVKYVASNHQNIKKLSTRQDLDLQEKNALRDCLEMLEQTLYELREAIEDLHDYHASKAYFNGPNGNLKTLLSAAMTNQNTCVDGVLELEEFDSENPKGLKDLLQDLLSPTTQMMSNCLGVINYMETETQQEILNDREMSITKIPKNGWFPVWMTPGDRNLMQKTPNMLPNIIVANDGSGDYETIGEALEMAPNRSRKRFVIKIKAGIYIENLEINREKTNIMLVGDGMNSTIITGSRSFADGFSTFTSATLTVTGDKFLAMDLTIKNTAGGRKFQAVAARVTSNSAFYRCNFVSYQDTLYAHSLRQFYRECTIQGTIDFIFGNAAVVFQNCLIIVRKPIPGQTNMITAQGRTDPNQNTGISLQNCTILAAPNFKVSDRKKFSTFLGRPWRNYSRTMVMKSYLGDVIDPKGWCKWDEYSTVDTVEYIEHLNYGPGSDTKNRVTWGGYRSNCSERVAKKFTVGFFLHGAGDWLESTGFPLFYGS